MGNLTACATSAPVLHRRLPDEQLDHALAAQRVAFDSDVPHVGVRESGLGRSPSERADRGVPLSLDANNPLEAALRAGHRCLSLEPVDG